MRYVVLQYKDDLYTAEVENLGNFTIGSGKKESLQVAQMGPAQITIKENYKGGLVVHGKDPTPFYDDDVPRDTMVMLSSDGSVVLYVASQTDCAEQTLKLPYNCVVNVGRSEKNDIVIHSPYVSGRHLTLRSEAGVIRVEDNHSTNGLFLNGKRISKARVRSGDVLSILHIKIRLVNNVLYFDNTAGALSVHELPAEAAIGGLARKEDSGHGTLRYRRSPRTQEQLPSEDIVLAPAPNAGGKFEKRRGILTSFLGTGAMFAANMAMGVSSPALVAARAASLVAPVTSIVSQTKGEKQRKIKLADYEQLRMEKYGQYIAEQKARIEEVATVQRDILTRENPPAQECLDSLRQLNRSLWERGPGDRDFLDVRLGMGYEKLCVAVKSREDSGFHMEADEVQELAERIIEETRIVDNVPARLQMQRYNTISVIGDRERVIGLVKNMLVSLTTAHCFEDVRIVGIFDNAEQERWMSLRWLPHVWDESRQFRFLAFDSQQAHRLCDLLTDTLKGRLRDAEGHQPVTPAPYYIFLLGSRAYTEREEIMQLLTANEPALGATTLFLFNDLYSLPYSCQFIVDVDNGPCAYVCNEVNNKFFFTMDPQISDNDFDFYARLMSAIELEGFASQADIPQGVGFLEGFGVTEVEQLDAPARWKRSEPYKSLAAPIGVLSGGKHFALDIHEKAHGPHGLVAGTTGSGKSELLQTWILSMALNYHPHDVVFVLIDYKGGGMANLLIDLPHVVGKITNIGSNIARSLISLQSEMKRRQFIFDEYQVNHIDKYQKLYREGKAREPLPHLIIVADEFAELKTNEPEFMAGLISASRIGRSLGVHLVLATQKPSGVVDEQIQSNSKFRLCLKVQNAGDSREMIRRPDAARITQSGRAYVLVGEDEVFELFQSYWSGAPYLPQAAARQESGNSVRIVRLNGERVKPQEHERTAVQAEMDELTAVRQYLVKAAVDNGIPKLPGPWLPELPETVNLADLGVPGMFDGKSWKNAMPWLRVPIGIYDAPATQSQGVQYLNLAEEGHYGIYGAPATGKTTLLKTILWSLGQYYSPADVNIYVLDCGGWSMNVLADMPHVGGVALDCEEEKFQKLTQMLLTEINDRKKRFLKQGVSSLTAYRQSMAGRAENLPAIVLAIDNIVPIFDQFPDMENLLVTVAREGAAYGIYMIYTANTTTGVRYKVLQNIRGAVALELTDKGDYAAIVGRLNGMTLPKVLGRAFFKGNPPLEFQAAMYVAGESEQERSEQIKRACAAMDAAWQGPRPAAIPVMPEKLGFAELFRAWQARTRVPVGIGYADTLPAYCDFSDRYCLLVSGTMNSGKSRLLAGMAAQMHAQRPQDKLYVFDSQRRALQALAPLTASYAAVSDAAAVSRLLAELVDTLNVRKRAQNEARAAAGDAFNEAAFIAEYEQLLIFVDDLKEFVDTVDNDSKNSMERICRLAQGLGVQVYAAGRVADLEHYNEIESLTRAIIANQRGIGIGGSASIHTYLLNDLDYKKKEQDAGAGNGYLFDNGHCCRIKLPGQEDQ